MAKKRMTFRLSDAALMVLAKHQLDHKLANMTEALEQILLSPQPRQESEQASGASDLLPCRQRIGTGSKLACLNPPTLYRKVKITDITPEICEACQILSKNLPDKYAVQETPTQEQTLAATESPEGLQRRNTDPTRTRNGMIWCPEGLWVFPNKCDGCKVKTYAVWYECQKEKLRQKGLTIHKTGQGGNGLEPKAMTSDTETLTPTYVSGENPHD